MELIFLNLGFSSDTYKLWK